MGLLETSEKPTYYRLNQGKSVINTDSSLIASPSTDLVFNPKYDAKVDIKLLKETEGVSTRVMIRRERSLTISALQ